MISFTFLRELSLPAPIFWGALACWIPLSPSVMAGLFIATLVYALLHIWLDLDDWADEMNPTDSTIPS